MTNDNNILIIAEAGVNHNGSAALAHKLVDIAADAKADVVKFQTFNSNDLASFTAPKADYQKITTDQTQSQLDMLRSLELPYDLHVELIDHCKARGISFLSAAFDLSSVTFLMGELNLGVIKIPSGEITNGPLLLGAARYQRKVILSTGMSTLDEVGNALDVLAFGFTAGPSDVPSKAAISAAGKTQFGQDALAKNVTILHCITEYPAPTSETNLRAMATLKERFGLPVGFSDHSKGITLPIAAAALGATVIEKHFTIDKHLPGPDHLASLEPDELNDMVCAIRDVESALGDGDKQPKPSEMKNMPIARKSLVAARPIKIGEPFTIDNVTVKRPGTGMSPMAFWDILGETADRDLDTDDVI